MRSMNHPRHGWLWRMTCVLISLAALGLCQMWTHTLQQPWSPRSVLPDVEQAPAQLLPVIPDSTASPPQRKRWPAAFTASTVDAGGPPSPPAPVRAVASSQTRVGAKATLPEHPATLTLTMGTLSMRRYVYNWLIHAERVPALAPYFAVSLDKQLFHVCTAVWQQPGLEAEALLLDPQPAVTVPRPASAFADDEANSTKMALESLHTIQGLQAQTVRGYLRNERAGFKILGFVKARIMLSLLHRGYDVLLSDADSVFLGDPWPWIGPHAAVAAAGYPLAADAGLLPTADVLLSNDYPDLRRDGQPDSVFNSGLAFFRSTQRAMHFVSEWGERTRRTAEIGNDQSEINRLLRGRYRSGDFRCNHDGCLEPDPMLFVPVAAAFGGPGCPAQDRLLLQLRGALFDRRGNNVTLEDSKGDGPCPIPCAWLAPTRMDDSLPGLRTVPLVTANSAWRECRQHQEKLGRRLVRQSRQVYSMWGGRVRFGLLPMERFLQGHTYFIQRLHDARGVSAVHVHLTYVMGADFGKEWRLRSEGLWREEPRDARPEAAAQGNRVSSSPTANFVRVTGVESFLTAFIDRMALPAKVWRCEVPDGHAANERKLYGYHTSPDRDETRLFDRPSTFFNGDREACYHPKHLIPEKRLLFRVNLTDTTDPASPHVALQQLLRELLRNAFALAYATNRRLVLPRLWALCERHWWQLIDCRTPGVESLPLPYEAPLDVAFDAEKWERIRGVGFVEHRYPGLDGTNVTTTRLVLQSTLKPGAMEVAFGRMGLPAETTFDGGADALQRAHPFLSQQPSIVEVDARHLLRFSACGFSDARLAGRFHRDVLEQIFAGQYSYCSEERNPFVSDLLKEAEVTHVPAEKLLVSRRNCTVRAATHYTRLSFWAPPPSAPYP
jgi:hypothetical protein